MLCTTRDAFVVFHNIHYVSSILRTSLLQMSSSSLPSSPPLSRAPRLHRASTDFILASLDSVCSNTNATPATSLLPRFTPPSSPPSSPSSLSSCSSIALDSSVSDQRPSAVWSCWYGCGKQYKKTSGRSIRRHVTCCFRQHWPGGETLTEAAVSELISSQQESGLLVTGLRKWRMRQSRRRAEDLPAAETWTCPFRCGKRYRSTRSRSIQEHANGCTHRDDDGVGDVDVKRLKTAPYDELQRCARQREDEQEIADRAGVMKEEGRGSGSSSDESAESRERTPERSTRCADICHHSFSLSWPSDTILSLPSPPSPIGTLGYPSSRGDLCPPTSSSPLASLHPTYQSWDPAPPAEPASVADLLQEVELQSQQQLYDDALAHQQQRAAAELHQLLLDIHARHGMQHPVFSQPAMASCLARLLTQGVTTPAWPSTTLPTQARSPSLPSPAPSITDVLSAPSSPPDFLMHPAHGWFT